ncbi:hypothetical protein AA313_de0201512 [Arthrobotrys entomopaga]|nr:hypothetical protein AA313_de0201512 [Arthrobotrys entomopaga]
MASFGASLKLAAPSRALKAYKSFIKPVQDISQPASPPNLGCAGCHSKNTKLTCYNCGSADFCNIEHLYVHVAYNEDTCTGVKFAIENLAQNTLFLESFTDVDPMSDLRSPSFILSPLLHVECPDIDCRCYCTPATQEYMLSRLDLIAAYRALNSHPSVAKACNSAIGTHYLDRCDNVNIRSITTNLMIRTGCLQPAYDFLKWWLVNGEYDCRARPPVPFLNIRNANPFERCNQLDNEILYGPGTLISLNCELPPASLLLSLALIKFKIMADVKELRNAQILRERLPFDIVYCIKDRVGCADIVRKRREIYNLDTVEEYDDVIAGLEEDLEAIFNRFVGLVRVGYRVCEALAARKFKASKPRNTRLKRKISSMYGANVDAWHETPGALDWIAEALYNGSKSDVIEIGMETASEAGTETTASEYSEYSEYEDEDGGVSLEGYI